MSEPNYLVACADHAEHQGLAKPAFMLTQAGIPFGLDQTGGMTMCINVTPEVDSEFRWIWVSWDGGDNEYIVGLYDSLDGTEGCEAQASACVSLEELIEMVQLYRGPKFKRITNLQGLTRSLDIIHDQLKDITAHWAKPDWEDFATAKVRELGAIVTLLSKEVLDECAD